jgi:hypothetical protein
MDYMHVLHSKEADFFKDVGKSILGESIRMQEEGGYYFKILFYLIKYMIFIEDDSPGLHPPGD